MNIKKKLFTVTPFPTKTRCKNFFKTISMNFRHFRVASASKEVNIKVKYQKLTFNCVLFLKNVLTIEWYGAYATRKLIRNLLHKTHRHKNLVPKIMISINLVFGTIQLRCCTDHNIRSQNLNFLFEVIFEAESKVASMVYAKNKSLIMKNSAKE